MEADDGSQSNGGPDLRKSHPGLHHSIFVVSFVSVALALNFWLTTPTFSPYGIHKNIIGTVFAVLGVARFTFLMLFRNLRLLRITLAVSVGWLMFWGLTNTQQFFNGKASLQLPIMYVALSLLQVPLLLEPPVNPYSEKK